MLKKVLIVFGSLIVLILAAAIILPIIFKDDIKAAIDAELEKSVNADVYFDPDNFNLTFFSNFPNLTVGLTDFGVFNREPFEGEILLAVKKFEVEVNLKSVLFDDQLRIKGITLNEPVINVIVNEDGMANYDIAIPSEDTVTVEETPDEEAGDFSFGIDNWQITNGRIVYDDKTIPVLTEIIGLNHQGSGDFTLDVFDLDIYTSIDTLNLEFDGTSYMSNKRIEADMIMNLDLAQSKYTFKENSFSINEFTLGFDGWISMPDENIDMDITYASKDNSFKSLLSLVPAVYTQDFDDIQTEGNLSFDGFVRGTYTETTMPAFNLGLLVENAMFKYPDLPSAVKNINVDLNVDNADGNIDNTVVDLRKFHMEFGNNPVDAKLLVKNLVNYPIDANVKAKLDLGELNTMFPVEGLEMRGIYSLDVTSKGIYDSIQNTIPTIDARMTLQDGYIKSSEFPIPLENMRLNSTIKNQSGKMAETFIKVEDFGMKMGEEEINASLTLEDLDNYKWDVRVDGGIDLGQIMEVFPQEGMTLAGKIYAQARTSGNMSALEAEEYDKLPTSGNIRIVDFKYVDEELLPQGFNISTANLEFDPRKIALKEFNATSGRTDMSVDGFITNYMNYILRDEVLRGTMNYTSKLVDLNEFMSAETTTTEEETSEDTELEVVEVPKNIDFMLNSKIDKVLYDNMALENIEGWIIIKDGIVKLDRLRFNMLGGDFLVNGSYSTEDPENPKFSFNLDIDQVSIKQSFATFNTVQKLAPIAQNVNGNASTEFQINGDLGQDMMPVMNSLNGGGLIKIASAAIQDSKLVAGVTSLTKLSDTNTASLKDVAMSATIKDGKLSVKPFNIKIGNYTTNVSGSTDLDGGLDYDLKMDIPAGKVGQQLNSTLASLTGSQADPSSDITLNIGVGGTYDDPKLQLLAAGTKDQVKQQLTEKAKDVAKEKVVDAIVGDDARKQEIADSIANVTEDLEAAKKEAEAKLKAKQDSIKRALEAEKKRKEDSIKKAAEEEAKKKLKSLFKKKDN